MGGANDDRANEMLPRMDNVIMGKDGRGSRANARGGIGSTYKIPNTATVDPAGHLGSQQCGRSTAF
eukprot:COSAG01_NODE_26349_length_716_cov_32.064830_1_plen_66_part_00